ncbi:MAG: hypothetical protein QOF01_1937 [Thermomicrobiales bacterium]|nr:hypothetical protein [Thermomicrobiales bacterium]
MADGKIGSGLAASRRWKSHLSPSEVLRRHVATADGKVRSPASWVSAAVPAMLVMAVHDRMSAPPANQPVVHRKRRDEGDGEGKGQTAPEEKRIESRLHRVWDGEHDSVVDDFHDCDRKRVGGKRQSGGLRQGSTGARTGRSVSDWPKTKASTTEIAIVGASRQPSAVPMIMPSTSPIAHPVKQCTVALKASRRSDGPCASRLGASRFATPTRVLGDVSWGTRRALVVRRSQRAANVPAVRADESCPARNQSTAARAISGWTLCAPSNSTYCTS